MEQRTERQSTRRPTKIMYWDELVDPKKNLSRGDSDVLRALQKLFDGETSSADLDLKFESDHRVWSARLNREDRILFASMIDENTGANVLVLLDIVRNHAYDKSYVMKSKQAVERVFTKARCVPKEDLEQIFKQNRPDSSPFEEKDDDEGDDFRCEMEPLYGVHGSAISLSPSQSKVVQGTTLPLIVHGRAGSGKSSVALLFLKKTIKELAVLKAMQSATLSQQNPDSKPVKAKRILFMAKSPQLIGFFERECRSWSTYNQHKEDVVVDFKTLEGMIRENMAQGFQFQSYDNFVSWISKQRSLVKTISGATHDQERYKAIYNEFASLTFVLNDIHSKEEKFSGELSESLLDELAMGYEKLGARQTRFSNKEAKEALIALYALYHTFLSNNKLVDVAFLEKRWVAKIAQSNYDVAIVEEVQDFHPSELLILVWLMKNNPQLLLTKDDNQSLDSGLQRIDYYIKRLYRDISETTLEANYRTPKRVSAFASKVLKLKNRVNDGLISSRQYTSYESKNNHEGLISFYDVEKLSSIEQGFLKQLAMTPDAAMLVFDEDSRDAAKKLFPSICIFTPPQIKGLEFLEIVLYCPFDGINPHQKKLISVLNEMIKSGEPLDLKDNLSKDKDSSSKYEEINKYLNGIFVGATRARKHLIILEKKHHQNDKICFFLRDDTGHNASTVIKELAVEDGDVLNKRWAERIKALEHNGNHLQLKEHDKTFISSFVKAKDTKDIKENLITLFERSNLNELLATQHQGCSLLHHMVKVDRFYCCLIPYLFSTKIKDKAWISLLSEKITGISSSQKLQFMKLLKAWQNSEEDSFFYFILKEEHLLKKEDPKFLKMLDSRMDLATITLDTLSNSEDYDVLSYLDESIAPRFFDPDFLKTIMDDLYLFTCMDNGFDILGFVFEKYPDLAKRLHKDSLNKILPGHNESVLGIFAECSRHAGYENILLLILQINPELIKYIMPEALFNLSTMDKTSAFYHLAYLLSSDDDGRPQKQRETLAVIFKHNASLLKKVTAEALFVETSDSKLSAINYLCISSAGLNILLSLFKMRPDLAASAVTSGHLFHPMFGNDSIFYYLTTDEIGFRILELLLKQDIDLAKHIPYEKLHQKNKKDNLSACEWLVLNKGGQPILDELYKKNPALNPKRLKTKDLPDNEASFGASKSSTTRILGQLLNSLEKKDLSDEKVVLGADENNAAGILDRSLNLMKINDLSDEKNTAEILDQSLNPMKTKDLLKYLESKLNITDLSLSEWALFDAFSLMLLEHVGFLSQIKKEFMFGSAICSGDEPLFTMFNLGLNDHALLYNMFAQIKEQVPGCLHSGYSGLECRLQQSVEINNIYLKKMIDSSSLIKAMEVDCSQLGFESLEQLKNRIAAYHVTQYTCLSDLIDKLMAKLDSVILNAPCNALM